MHRARSDNATTPAAPLLSGNDDGRTHEYKIGLNWVGPKGYNLAKYCNKREREREGEREGVMHLANIPLTKLKALNSENVIHGSHGAHGR